MTNILDYLATDFDTFETRPFGPVDSLVLSEFAMVELEGILNDIEGATAAADPGRKKLFGFLPARDLDLRFSDLLRAEHFPSMFTGFVPDNSMKLLVALASSPRFRTMRIRSYRSILDAARHVQFAAVTLSYKNLFTYVAFRGTDSTIAGWREDFEMAFEHPVPAQKEARIFLEQTLAKLPKSAGEIYVGGHSKGGNLAVYSAINVPESLSARITRVFDHDGPGFMKDAIAPQCAVYPKIHKTVPAESFVGMLLDSPVAPHVIESSERGLLQHDGFSWQIDGGDFVYADALTDTAQAADRVMDAWLESCSDEEKRAVVDLLFSTLEASGADKIPQIAADWKTTVPLMLSAIGKADGTKSLAWKATTALSDAVIREIGRKRS